MAREFVVLEVTKEELNMITQSLNASSQHTEDYYYKELAEELTNQLNQTETSK